MNEELEKEIIISALTKKMSEIMKKEKVSRSKLATLIERRCSDITRILSGRDFRISTASKIFCALGYRIKIEVKKI